MKKKILISSFDMAIGGVERSLIGLLTHFDYDRYDVDLLLFRQEGEFLPLLPSGPNLLPEIPKYTTFRKSIKEIVKEGYLPIGTARLMAKSVSLVHGKLKNIDEPGYLSIQYGWEFASPFLPKVNQEYDAAIGFLWPHHFIGNKIKAKKKIGWIHTDYSNIFLNKQMEIRMWNKVDQIVAVSEDCSKTFLSQFPAFTEKTSVIENILSPEFIQEQAKAFYPLEMKKEPGKTLLVTVGRLSHAKGLDIAIRACKKLLDSGNNVEWHVIGYGPLEDELNKLIAELGLQNNFFLLGKKINPYPYIKQCDIYVQPSRYEGKAVTIREAQILNKPVVITNFPTAKSQAQDGIDALITHQTPEGIAEGITRLIENSSLCHALVSNVSSRSYGNEGEIEKLYKLIES